MPQKLITSVIDSLPAHIAVLDASGTITATNAAWDRFARENGGDARGRCGVGSNYLQVCQLSAGQQASGAANVVDGLRAVLAHRESQFRLEYRCDSATEQRWFVLTITPLNDPAGGAVVAHVDVSALKRAQRATKRRAKKLDRLARQLKARNEELDQFAYITSHDLRAPLRGIANLSRWIEEDMGDKFTPEGHDQMNLLRGRVARMEGLIDGILEYSRIGRVHTQPEPVNVALLLAQVIDLLDPPKGFTIEVEPGMPTLLAEKVRLQQVFMNLIGNAIKHHDRPEGRIQVSCAKTDGFHEFAVSDDGPGIDPKYHDRVFVIFQTLVARDRREGTGVGLSLVKKIVENEGGVVRIDSEAGQRGTTFRFTFPSRDGEIVNHGT